MRGFFSVHIKHMRQKCVRLWFLRFAVNLLSVFNLKLSCYNFNHIGILIFFAKCLHFKFV